MFKKFVISFFCITLALLIAAGSVVYVIDPFNVYRADKDMTKIIYQMPYYQNVGIAKHTEYDTLITGSSMTQNFRGYWFDEKLNCKAIRLSFDGGIVSDFEALLKTAVKRKELKSVYFGLDNYLLTADSRLNDETARIPGYLIDDNPINDVKYLLNKDVLFNYIVTYFSYKNSDTYDFYEMHAWDTLNPVYSKEKVIGNTEYADFAEPVSTEAFFEDCDVFLDSIGRIVEDNQNVQFVFFAPPYSIMYWYNLLREGKLDATICALKYVYSELLKHGNVRVFYFQNDYERIMDLDKYKDANHYCTDYNKYMLDCFISGEREITAETYESVLDGMESYAHNYDFKSLLSDKE